MLAQGHERRGPDHERTLRGAQIATQVTSKMPDQGVHLADGLGSSVDIAECGQPIETCREGLFQRRGLHAHFAVTLTLWL